MVIAKPLRRVNAQRVEAIVKGRGFSLSSARPPTRLVRSGGTRVPGIDFRNAVFIHTNALHHTVHTFTRGTSAQLLNARLDPSLIASRGNGYEIERKR